MGGAARGLTVASPADRAIYNYLLLLHAEQPDGGASLLGFLGKHLPPAGSPLEGGPPFDLEYALRVCVAQRQSAATVRVYAAMGLLEEAVTLALEVTPPALRSGSSPYTQVPPRPLVPPP